MALTDAKTALQTARDRPAVAPQIDFAKRTIKAPFAGIIGLSDISVGDLVSSSKAIGTLDDMSKATVAFDVPGARLRPGRDRPAGLATTAALAGQTFKGAISAVDSRVDPVARTLRVEATLPNDADVLKPGMALTVAMCFPGEPHPAVPSLAVQWDRGGSYVWKVDGDVVHRVAVQIIGRRSGAVVVSGELAENDQVVVEGLQRLREGSQVTVAGADQQTGQGNRPQAQGSGESAGPEAAAVSGRRPGRGSGTAQGADARDARQAVDSEATAMTEPVNPHASRDGGFASLFVRRPVLAIVLNLLIVIAGVAAYRGIEVRELPNIDRPVITVRTNYTGATPETIDKEVTSVIEGAVARTPGVVSICRQSSAGQSRVTIEFDQKTDINVAANDLRDAIGNLRSLPTDAISSRRRSSRPTPTRTPSCGSRRRRRPCRSRI